MIGELISVGTELLMGQIVNTNVQYLAQKLNEMGINLYHQSTVGDNMGRLTQCLQQALERADLVVLCGGLGPTQDDLTKWAVAEVLGVEMREDAQSRQDLIALFQKRYQRPENEITENNFRQACFPAGATIFPNPNGTAPGCACEKDGKIVVVLPGPPRELEPMMQDSVLPFLEARLDSRIASRFIRIFGMGESALEEELRDLIDAQDNPTIAPYAGFIDVALRVTARVPLGDDPMALIAPMVQKINQRLGHLVYSNDNESMEEVLARLMNQNKVTLAVAESLTGGMVCDRLVNVPGISAHFLEGVVAYTRAAKERLGVRPETLDAHSAVSAEVAAEMATCIRQRAGSDWAIATTGVAGPGPDAAGNPEGLVYICVAGPNGQTVVERSAGLGRARIRQYVFMTALNTLRMALEAQR